MPETPLPTPHDYRFAQTFTVRLVGLSVVALALVLFVGTAVVALAGVNADVLVVVLALGLLGRLRARLVAAQPRLRAARRGRRVRRRAGARRGRQAGRLGDVTEATTAAPHGIDCLVLHLGDGRHDDDPGRGAGDGP